MSRSDSQSYQNPSAPPQNGLASVQNALYLCIELLRIRAPQITNMVPFVVPLGSIDDIDACTNLSENWALLAWVGCMGAADTSLQLDLSGPVPTTVRHLCP